MKNDPKLGRAEALRRAMLAYMNDATDPWNAYPAIWAPFVVLGVRGRAVTGAGERCSQSNGNFDFRFGSRTD